VNLQRLQETNSDDITVIDGACRLGVRLVRLSRISINSRDDLFGHARLDTARLAPYYWTWHYWTRIIRHRIIGHALLDTAWYEHALWSLLCQIHLKFEVWW